VEKEDTLSTAKRRNAVCYDAVIPSGGSGSQIPKNHKLDNVEKSRLCNSLLLYRLVDAISFAKKYDSNDSMLPRETFSILNIPVNASFNALLSQLIMIRAGMDSAVIGPDLFRKREIHCIHFH